MFQNSEHSKHSLGLKAEQPRLKWFPLSAEPAPALAEAADSPARLMSGGLLRGRPLNVGRSKVGRDRSPSRPA